MRKDTIYTVTGRTPDELTMEAIRRDDLTAEDFRISGETLRNQAGAAETAGYRQFAENLRRAAELTNISNEEVFEIYNTLRPGRTTYSQLVALADRLENELVAPLNAALVREAAEVYLARGLVKGESS